MKRKEWKEVIKFTDEALKIDHKCIKALFFKGKASIEETEYKSAIDCLTDLLEFEPTHEEAENELARV